jgi:hypothetical protein
MTAAADPAAHHAIGDLFTHIDGVPLVADASASHDCGDPTLFVGLPSR